MSIVLPVDYLSFSVNTLAWSTKLMVKILFIKKKHLHVNCAKVNSGIKQKCRPLTATRLENATPVMFSEGDGGGCLHKNERII